MRVPRVNGRQTLPADDGAAVFWATAQAMASAAGRRDFSGDLWRFGFRPDRREANLDRLRNAVVAAGDVAPNISAALGPATRPQGDHSTALFDAWAQGERALFWAHPGEDSLALTLPYTYKRPYGDGALILVNFTMVEVSALQNKRNGALGRLEVAQHRSREHGHLGPVDAYVARGGGFGGTFAFAKHSAIGGRDRETLWARGYALSRGDADRIDRSDDAAGLFLEVMFDEIAV